MRKIVIFGATSAIAQETAKLFAGDGDALFLVGRNTEHLENVAADLKVRGASQVYCHATPDLTRHDVHEELIKKAEESLRGIDTVLIAYGSLPDQKTCEKDFVLAKRAIDTNFLSVVSLLTLLANHFEQQGHGCLAVISSVAGDRGRQSNYVYGSAKGALSVFLQGLRNRLSKSGITVTTIKPGFVDTPMTEDLKKGALFVGPDIVARGIYKAILKNKDVVYLPSFWRWIMGVVKIIPESIFKKLSF